MDESYEKASWIVVALGILVIGTSSLWGIYRAAPAVASAEPEATHFVLPAGFDRPFCWMSNRPLC
jgi:hypothetical protein